MICDLTLTSNHVIQTDATFPSILEQSILCEWKEDNKLNQN